MTHRVPIGFCLSDHNPGCPRGLALYTGGAKSAGKANPTLNLA